MQRHRIAARPRHALASPAPSLVPPFRPLRPRQARIHTEGTCTALLLIGCGYGFQQRPSVLELRQPATGHQRSSLSHHALNLPPARLPRGSSVQHAIVAAAVRRGLPASGPGLLCAEPAVSGPSSDERLSQRCLSPAVWRAWHQRPEHGLGSPVLPPEPWRQCRKGRPICW